jgi:hypothetical protein
MDKHLITARLQFSSLQDEIVLELFKEANPNQTFAVLRLDVNSVVDMLRGRKRSVVFSQWEQP